MLSPNPFEVFDLSEPKFRIFPFFIWTSKLFLTFLGNYKIAVFSSNDHI